MIEQTELIVTEWHYHPLVHAIEAGKEISSITSLDVMKKRAATKKGIACRLNCRFFIENETILEYVAEHSYVIDLEDRIEKHELLRMLRNSYVQYKAIFDLRKLGTVLQTSSLRALDETRIELDTILPMLNG